MSNAKWPLMGPFLCMARRVGFPKSRWDSRSINSHNGCAVLSARVRCSRQPVAASGRTRQTRGMTGLRGLPATTSDSLDREQGE